MAVAAGLAARVYDDDMGIGFGRVVVDGVTLDDPYTAGLDELTSFDVISVAGSSYRVERVDHRRWTVHRMESTHSAPDGFVHRGGNTLNRWYSFKRRGRLVAAGQQSMFINGVFGLIGLLDGDVFSPDATRMRTEERDRDPRQDRSL